MKNINRILFIFFLTILLSPGSVFGFDGIGIKVDSKLKALVAPDACSYQWFKEGVPIKGGVNQSFSIDEGGTYTVQVTEESGYIYTEDISVAITSVGAIIKIYTIGDSTVQDYTDGYYPRKGWGQMLPYFFNSSNVQVINKAVGGTSSKSFYNNFWTPIKNALQPGDFVFIQFGINDRNNADTNRYAPTGGVFEGYLTKFVNEAKAKGAYPVLVATLRRNAWNADGVTVYDSYHDHPIAVRKVANNLKVPLIDLDAKAKVQMETLGKNYTTRFWYNNYVAGEYPNYTNGNTDDVHFQEMGAIAMADLIVKGIEELKSDVNLSKLVPYIKPRYNVNVSVNPVGSDLATTKSSSYPEGLTITLKTLPKTDGTFQKWNNTSGSQLSTKSLTTIKSGTTPLSFAAIYKGAVTTCSATISTSGTVSFCEGGSVTLTASVGSTYLWKSGSTQVGTTQSFVAKSNGTYTVEVTDANGCKAVSSGTVVTVQPKTNWYADTDGDGKGDASQSQLACVQPSGHITDKSDLCPNDKNKSEPGNCGCGKTETSCFDCANVLNGSATLDACGICVGGNTGKKACVYKLQAEEACEADGIKNEATNAGFEGIGYVNGDNAIGKSVTFSLDAATSGNYKLLIRYSNGGATSRSSGLELNLVEQNRELLFLTTGAFTTWSTLEIEVYLNEGNNILKLISKTADGLPNIDYLGFIDNTVSAGPCIVTGNNFMFTSGYDSNYLNTSPQPFDSEITISFKNKSLIQSVVIYNLLGEIVYDDNHINTDEISLGENLLAGVYVLKVLNKNHWYTSKIVKIN